MSHAPNAPLCIQGFSLDDRRRIEEIVGRGEDRARAQEQISSQALVDF